MIITQLGEFPSIRDARSWLRESPVTNYLLIYAREEDKPDKPERIMHRTYTGEVVIRSIPARAKREG